MTVNEVVTWCVGRGLHYQVKPDSVWLYSPDGKLYRSFEITEGDTNRVDPDDWNNWLSYMGFAR